MKKFLLLVLLTFGSISTVFSQDIIEHEKTHYVDGDKLYWNKYLPIYITLSSPSLDGVELKKPFYLDTEGSNWIRTKWEMDSTRKYVYPQREQTWEIIADGIAPKTRVEFIATEKYVFRGKTYYSDDLRLKLTSKDNLSGINKIYYSVNDADYLTYDTLVSVEPGLDITFKFYAIDNVGNREEISDLSYEYDNNNINFAVDNKAPVSKAIIEDDILSPRDVIVIETEDEGVGVNQTFYRFNEDGYLPYLKPISLKDFEDGKYKFIYYSQDWINNVEISNEKSFYLDAKAPEVEVEEEVIVDNLTNLRYITLKGLDNKSGVDKIYVQLKEGDEYIEYLKPFYVDIAHQTIKIKVVDKVGNVGIRTIEYSKNE
jgi:hypothetical protein